MAMTKISDVMDEVLIRQIDEMKDLKPSDTEFSKAEEAIAKLYKVRQEHYATDISDEEKMTQIENDKANEEAKINIESEKIKVEREKMEIEKAKIELAKGKDSNEKAIEEAKIEIEKAKIELEKQKIEIEQAKMDYDANKSKKDRVMTGIEIGTNVLGSLLHVTVEAAAIIIPIMFYNEWMKQGLEFEKDGTFTSQTFKGIISKFKPTRK